MNSAHWWPCWHTWRSLAWLPSVIHQPSFCFHVGQPLIRLKLLRTTPQSMLKKAGFDPIQYTQSEDWHSIFSSLGRPPTLNKQVQVHVPGYTMYIRHTQRQSSRLSHKCTNFPHYTTLSTPAHTLTSITSCHHVAVASTTWLPDLLGGGGGEVSDFGRHLAVVLDRSGKWGQCLATAKPGQSDACCLIA